MTSVALSASATCAKDNQIDFLSGMKGTHLRRSTLRKTTASRLKYLFRRSCWETGFVRIKLEDLVLGLEVILSIPWVWSSGVSPFEDATLSPERHFLCLDNPLRVNPLSNRKFSSSNSSTSVGESHSVRAGVEGPRGGVTSFLDGSWFVRSILLGFVTIGIRFAMGFRWP